MHFSLQMICSVSLLASSDGLGPATGRRAPSEGCAPAGPGPAEAASRSRSGRGAGARRVAGRGGTTRTSEQDGGGGEGARGAGTARPARPPARRGPPGACEPVALPRCNGGRSKAAPCPRGARDNPALLCTVARSRRN